MDLLARIDNWGLVAPERPAHVSEGRTLTYGELRTQSDILAAWLEEKLGANRAPVAVIGHKEPEMMIAFLASVKSGRPYVPIDISIPSQRAERIVQSAGSVLTLTPEVVREALRAGPKDLRPEVDPASGEMKLRATFRVVEKVENKKDEIEFEHAKTFKADVQVGEDLELLLTPRDFGRIMGQNAWAVIQRRRERGEIEEPPKPVSGDGPHCFSVPISISDPTQSAGSALTHMPEGVLETIRAASKKAMRGASDEAADPRDLRAEIDPTLGEIKLGTKFSVVEKVENGDNEIGLELARTLKADVQVGEDLEVLLSPEDFGRIMGQNATEVMKRHREQGVKEGKPSWMPKPVSGDDPYYIIFTSGSTGEPKGVVITLNCLTTFVIWTLGEQKFPDLDETFLNQAPFSFDLSVMDLYSSLASGGTLFSITREAIANPKVLYQQLAKSGITTWVSTPSFAQMCLVEKSFGPEMLPQIRRFWFCGETLANETAAQLLDRFPNAEVWNTYGPTEATVATTSIRVDRDVITNHAPLPVGYVMPGTRIAIMDENRATVPEGERGEIVIIGPNVSPGYLGRADLTEKAFFATESTRAYRTGDWGRTRGGLIFFEGRMDGQIKLHGYRIELGDIESHLRNLPQISDAVVLVAEKNGKPDSLAGFVVLRERGTGSDFDISLQFKKLLGERLPTYMVPRKFWFLDAFPMTANGKADRRKLAELLR